MQPTRSPTGELCRHAARRPRAPIRPTLSAPESHRRLGRVEPAAVIGIDEVEPDRLGRDQQLACTRRALGIEALRGRSRRGRRVWSRDHPPRCHGCVAQARCCGEERDSVRLVRRAVHPSSTRRVPNSAAKPWSSPSIVVDRHLRDDRRAPRAPPAATSGGTKPSAFGMCSISGLAIACFSPSIWSIITP